MSADTITLDIAEVRKLLLTGSGDTARLYLYLQCGGTADKAAQTLGMNHSAYDCAAATLRQLGLWQGARANFIPGERPNYSEVDVLHAMDGETEFRALTGEVQRLLGKTLNTEELKILLGFTRYLNLPADVISVLICYCKDRNRRRGSLRNPSLRSIEKEAYAWAERGIDTMAEASAYIQSQNQRNSRIGQLQQVLQIHGRNLTPGEERYAGAWIEMGFEMDAIAMAYERTCLNTGGLNWAYMNKILTRWHESGLHTAEAVKRGSSAQPKGAAGELGQAELEAIRKFLQEG